MSYYQKSYYYENISYFRPPITSGVRTLILINITVFVIQLIIGLLISISNSLFNGSFFISQSLSYFHIFYWIGFNVPMFVKGALWQPLTYMFIHSSLMHLFFNMLWLYVFGPEVEIYFTKKRFITFYLFCGVISVLVNFIPFVIRGFQPPVIGASGSIMAVLIAFAYINPEREFILFPLPIPINARGIVILVILMNLFYTLGETQYSVLTHFAGMGIGYLYISADYLGILYKIKKALGLDKFDVI